MVFCHFNWPLGTFRFQVVKARLTSSIPAIESEIQISAACQVLGKSFHGTLYLKSIAKKIGQFRQIMEFRRFPDCPMFCLGRNRFRCHDAAVKLVLEMADERDPCNVGVTDEMGRRRGNEISRARLI